MPQIDKILEYNRKFVAADGAKPLVANKFPALNTAIISCMDTRLTLLLPTALGLRNGDVKLITNAGGVTRQAYGETVRSLLVAIYELGVTEVMVIGHTDCGAAGLNPEHLRHIMHERGISDEAIAEAGRNTDFDAWLTGHGDTPKAVTDTLALLRNHPLIPADVEVRGFVLDTLTGALAEI